MEECIWEKQCSCNNECENCLYYDKEIDIETYYINRTDFYKDWFEYIERRNED